MKRMAVALIVLMGWLAAPAEAGQSQPQQGAVVDQALQLTQLTQVPPPTQPTQPAQPTEPVQPPRPYRGLFEAGSPARPGGHVLDFTASVYEEYGNTQDQGTQLGPLVLDTGWFLGVQGGLSYRKAGQWTQLGLRTDGSFRYYRDSGQSTLPRYSVQAGVDRRIGGERQSAVRFGGSVNYEPYYMLSLLETPVSVVEGAAIVPTNRDDLLYRQARYIFGQSFGFDLPLSARSFFTLTEDARATKADIPGLDVRTMHVAAAFGYRFSRYVALRLGYGTRFGSYGAQAQQRLQTHDIDISLDYRRLFAPSRRTTFGFETGSQLVTAESRRQWRVIGAVNVRHQFDAGWFIQGDLARTTQLVEGFSNPLFVNTATGSLGGFLGRRVELLTSGAYSRGVVGFTRDPYWAVQGSARMRLAVARFVAIDVEGLMARHSFDSRIVLPAGLPSQLNRWSVRFNVALWLPLFR